MTVVINYRLAPGVTHPAHVQDAAASFAWVKRHIADYGGDPGRVFLIGYSAGGYLAALLSTDPRYLAAHKLSPRDILGTVPVSALRRAAWRGAGPRQERVRHESGRLGRRLTGHHLRPDALPMLILYADGDEDWRRQQNVKVAAAMKAVGHANVELAMIANRTHATIWTSVAADRDEAAERIIRFVSR